MERKFLPVSIALLTVSDTRVFETDKSGNLLANKIEQSGHILFDRKLVKDEILDIQKASKKWIKQPNVEVIISTGGTGLTGRDVSPAAFRPISDKEIEGFGELFRFLSFNNWYINNTIKSSCGRFQWYLYFYFTRKAFGMQRCMGTNFSSSIGL